MSQPRYLITIDKKNYEAPCLAKQLIEILRQLQPFVKDLIWYISDIEATTFELIEDFDGFIPVKIGSTLNIIELCKKIDQFVWGVFLGLPIDQGTQLNGVYGTEDEQFREIGEAVLEIRAFDTTFYEIFTNNFSIIEVLATVFDSTPQFNPKYHFNK